MKDLLFDVEGQSVTRKDENSIVNCSSEYLRLCFEFSEDWSNLNKFIFFKCSDANYRYAIINDKIIVPSAFLTHKKLVFGVYGVNDDVRVTTNPIRINFIDSKFNGEFRDYDPSQYQPDVIEELYVLVNGKVDKEEGKGLFSGSYNDLTDKPSLDDLDGFGTVEAEITYVDESSETVNLVIYTPGD